MEERRNSPRVEPVGDCIVVHSKTIGNIKNISRGGVCCSCFQESDLDCDDCRKIDILCGEGKFLIQGLRVKVVKMENSPGNFMRDMQVTKCRMQFEDLQEEQLSGIENIINGASFH